MGVLEPSSRAGRGDARVLIGIPSFRRPDGLRRLLRSLSEQRSVEDLDVQLFVADSDAAAGEAEGVCTAIAAAYRWPLSCELVNEPGISAARNAILDYARTREVDFVAMIDDDEEAEPDWLRELLEMQKETGADVVGGPVYYRLERTAPKVVTDSGVFQPRPWAAGRVPSLDQTGNVLLSCDALEELGWPLFDANFGTTGGGDKEFFTRIRKQGATFAWAPTAIAREHVPASRSTPIWLLRRSYRTGNSDLRITSLHDGKGAVLVSLGKAALLLASAPFTLPMLLVPSRRLRLMRRWARSLGKFAALGGRYYHEYRTTSAKGAS